MNCRSAESQFSSYLEDEVSQEERRSIEAHLMGCRRCSLGLRELKAAMSLLQEKTPEIETSAHFEEDVLARIRSGEGLRPSAADWIRELFAPARLRPVFMTGAAACAVFIAVLVSPAGKALLVKRDVAPQTASVAPRIAPEATTSPSAPVVEGVRTSPRGAGLAATMAAAPRRETAAVRDSIVDSQVPEQRYRDEIINDQFYLDRGLNAASQDGQDPTVQPVNESSDDGTYIVF
jgi:putative zinc finger protein